MLETIFGSILTAGLTGSAFVICLLVALALGALVAAVYMYKNTYTQSMAVTLALLPAMVQVIILLVNGNLGAGVAVSGAFSLVRFRSAAGSARDITCIFLAMTLGLATGMGFIILAVVFTAIVAIVNVIYVMTPFGKPHEPDKMLRITIPEDLEYDGVFEEALGQYATEYKLMNVQTTNMGSLFQLEYMLRLKEQGLEKALIDELRCLNGNLKISLGYAPKTQEVL